MSVALLALAGLMAALLALFLLPEGGPPEVAVVKAGEVKDFPPGTVTTFREELFHLVRLENGDFVALFMVDPHDQLLVEEGAIPSGCLVPWRPEFEFMDRKGWFRNPCHGETYDMAGHRIFGPAPRDLDRHPVVVSGGAVYVDLSRLICGRSPIQGYQYPKSCTPPESDGGGKP